MPIVVYTPAGIIRIHSDYSSVHKTFVEHLRPGNMIVAFHQLWNCLNMVRNSKTCLISGTLICSNTLTLFFEDILSKPNSLCHNPQKAPKPELTRNKQTLTSVYQPRCGEDAVNVVIFFGQVVTSWIDGGTLSGAVRHADIMPWGMMQM